MNSLLKNVMLLSLCHVVKHAAEIVAADEDSPASRERSKDDEEKELKRKLLAAHILHTLLGTIYND